MGGKKKEVLEDENEEIVWDGLLVILVNELFVLVFEILVVVM